MSCPQTASRTVERGAQGGGKREKFDDEGVEPTEDVAKPPAAKAKKEAWLRGGGAFVMGNLSVPQIVNPRLWLLTAFGSPCKKGPVLIQIQVFEGF